MQAYEGCDQEEQALRVADAEVPQERIGRRHPLRREKEEGGVDEGYDDCDLEEIEKDLGLHPGAPIGRQEKHHQDRSAIEAVEQVPCRIRQGGLVEHGVIGLEGGGNQQNHQDGGEQEPEQGGNVLRTTECTPDASEGENTTENEHRQGQTETRPAGSEHEEAQRLSGDEGGEEKTHEPRLAEVPELAQAGAAMQVEVNRTIHY